MRRIFCISLLVVLTTIFTISTAQAEKSKTKKQDHQTVTSLKQGKKQTSKSLSAQKSRASSIVNINTADKKTLETVPHIGPKIAQRIVDYRKTKTFTKLEDLLQIKGIGPKTLHQLKPFISFR